MRATRDLLRRRLHLVRLRGELLTHIQNTYHQHNLALPAGRIAYKSNRGSVGLGFADPSTRRSVAVDLELIEHDDQLIRELELFLVRQTKSQGPHSFHRLRTIPGVGKILSMTILYEIHDLARFLKTT